MSGLYIHIPFCATKCSYCDFYSMPLKSLSTANDYIDAVINEFHLRKHELSDAVNTVYIGGGTPSQLPVESIARLVNSLGEAGVDFSSVSEFTIEANPEDIDSRWARAIAATGADRVSIGIQSFNDEELRTVGRRHDAQRAIDAIATLRDAGITEISGDLIYGLPAQTLGSWEESLNKILELNLPHISAYSLSYEPGTRLSAMLSAGKIKAVDEDTSVAMYSSLIKRLRENGYIHYEISNFSLPGHEARHNSAYWNFTPYLGLGPGAHSFDGKTRRSNPWNLKKYIAALTAMESIADEETEDDDDLVNDYIITALRQASGIDFNAMSRRVGSRAVDTLHRAAAPFVKAGSLIDDGGSLRFTEEAWLISDMVLRDLLQ